MSGKNSQKLQGMFTKGFLSAWMSLVTLPVIANLEHKLGQTKKHVSINIQNHNKNNLCDIKKMLKQQVVENWPN